MNNNFDFDTRCTINDLVIESMEENGYEGYQANEEVMKGEVHTSLFNPNMN